MWKKIVSIFSGLLKHKVASIVVAVSVVVVGGATVGSVAYANTPENLTARSLTRVIDGLTERSELEFLFDVLSKGSVDISLGEITCEQTTSDGVSEEEETFVVFDGEITGKAYFSNKAIFFENLKFANDDMQIKGNAYFGEDMIYIKEEEIFNTEIGFKYGTAETQLDNSIFAYGSGTDYEIADEELYNALLSSLKGLDKNVKVSKDFKKLSKRVLKDIWKIVCDNAVFEKENDKVRIDGDKINARVITIEINAEILANIIADVYDYLLEDEKIINFLDKYEEYFSIFAYNYGIDSLLDFYKEFLEENREDIDDECDYISDSSIDIEIELTVSKTGADLLGIVVKEDSHKSLEVEFGKKGLRKTDKVVIDLGEIEYVYDISQNDREEYNSTLTKKATFGKQQEIEITVDKKKETYKVNYKEGNMVVFKVQGDYIRKGKTLTLTLDRITKTSEYRQREKDQYGDYYYKDYQVKTTYRAESKIVLSKKDKMPSVPKSYKEISDITEEELNGWLEKLADLPIDEEAVRMA